MKEAQLAISYGVDALGLLGSMPSSPRGIDMELARDIAGSSPPGVETFLLSESFSGHEIAKHAAYCGTTTIQIVQHIEVHEYEHIVEQIPNVKRVQVVHVEDRNALGLIETYEPFVHAFILDSGTTGTTVAGLGGTGRVHDWAISSEFARRTSKPVYLAGGLNPQNVKSAISTVAPFGVDVCSGVRRNKKLDAQLLDNFTSNVF